MTHTDALSVPGWTGAGYIIYDPMTGDGAYKIAGGGNGGWFDLDEIKAFGKAIGMAAIVTTSITPFILMAACLGPIAIALVALAAWIAVWFIASENIPKDSSWRGWWRDLASGIAITIAGFLLFGGVMAAVLAGVIVSLIYATFDIFIYAQTINIYFASNKTEYIVSHVFRRRYDRLQIC